MDTRRADTRWVTRAAEHGDCAAIAAIYNAGISEGTATLETEPRTPGDIEGWIRTGYPVVVATGPRAGGVVAFAAASPYSSRACYDHVADFAVYVAPADRGCGAGSAAVRALIDAARAGGRLKLTSKVLVDNASSRRMLGRLGFREVGVHERHGAIRGVWHDAVVVELLL